MIVAVIGPPCSGKSTYIAEHRQPGDVVIDYDTLAIALGSDRDHDHSRDLIPLVEVARRAIISEWIRRKRHHKLWIIFTYQKQLRILPPGYQRIVLQTDLHECERRALAGDRDSNTIDVIRNYHNRNSIPISGNSRIW